MALVPQFVGFSCTTTLPPHPATDKSFDLANCDETWGTTDVESFTIVRIIGDFNFRNVLLTWNNIQNRYSDVRHKQQFITTVITPLDGESWLGVSGG